MKHTFPELFKKYRLRAEFEKLSEFGDALAEKGLYYEDSIFSHWQKGTRIPHERKVLLTLLEIFIEHKSITSLYEANELLESAQQGYLTEREIKKIFINSIKTPAKINLLEQINKLIFFLLAIIALILFLTYSFVDIQNVFIFLAFIVNFCLSLICYFRVQKTSTFLSFLITAFGISAWCLGMIFYRAVDYVPLTLIAAKVLYSIPVITPTSFLLFGLLFPEKQISKKIIILLISITLLVMTVTLMKNTVIIDVIVNQGKEKTIIFGWAYYWIYIVYYPVFFLSCYIVLIKKYMKTKSEKKMQILFILLGFSLASGISLVTNLILPSTGNFTFNWVDQVSTIFWILGVSYAILKYKLINISVKNFLNIRTLSDSPNL